MQGSVDSISSVSQGIAFVERIYITPVIEYIKNPSAGRAFTNDIYMQSSR